MVGTIELLIFSRNYDLSCRPVVPASPASRAAVGCEAIGNGKQGALPAGGDIHPIGNINKLAG